MAVFRVNLCLAGCCLTLMTLIFIDAKFLLSECIFGPTMRVALWLASSGILV